MKRNANALLATQFTSLLLSTILTSACGGAEEFSDINEPQATEDAETSDEALASKTNLLRLPPKSQTEFTLTACFYAHGSHLNGMANVVRDAVTNSWETATGITFDWQTAACSGDEDLRFTISDDPADSLITRTDEIGGSEISINMAKNPIGSPFCKSSGAQWNRCIASSAAHEVGHALGFVHEQDRDDWVSCSDGSAVTNTGTTFDLEMGFVDADSVMGYCYRQRVTRANILTANDVDWAGRMYGNGRAVRSGRWYAARNVDHGNYMRLSRTFFSQFGDIISPEWRPRIGGEPSTRRNVIKFKKKSGGSTLSYGDLVSVYDNTREMYYCPDDIVGYGPIVNGSANECFWEIRKLDKGADSTVRVHEPVRLVAEFPVNGQTLSLGDFRLLGHFDNLD